MKCRVKVISIFQWVKALAPQAKDWVFESLGTKCECRDGKLKSKARVFVVVEH